MQSATAENQRDPSKNTSRWRQILTLLIMMVANFSSTVTFSCIVPFYPIEAKKRGLQTADTGFVIGFFQLVMLFTTPLVGKYMHYFGAKRVFYVGLLISGVTSIIFGLLKFVPGGASMFFWSTFFVRCFQALGNALFVTSSMTLCASCFPHCISRAMSFLGCSMGLGYTLGPLIGSALYEYGGFQLPFVTLGILLLVSSLLSFGFIQDVDASETDDHQESSEQAYVGSKSKHKRKDAATKIGTLSLLRIPSLWLPIFAVVLQMVSVTFYDASITEHLASFEHSSAVVAVMLALSSVGNVLASPICGIVLDRWHCFRQMMALGVACAGVSVLAMGPSSVLPLEKTIPVLTTAFLGIGLAEAMLYTATFQMCITLLIKHEIEGNVHTYGLVSGIIQSASAFGSFVGATGGGIGAGVIGFAWTATLVSALFAAYFLIFALYHLKKWLRVGKRRIVTRIVDDNRNKDRTKGTKWVFAEQRNIEIGWISSPPEHPDKKTKAMTQ